MILGMASMESYSNVCSKTLLRRGFDVAADAAVGAVGAAASVASSAGALWLS
jgi:hypothetical protein